ncbi:MAG: metallophosphoesterase family protein [Myxococcota bacterium]
MPRTLVVGDVHGCRRELDALLERFGWQTGDRLVLVGDLVAKGPDSLGVVRRAQELGAVAVRGNHDEICLRWWRARRDGHAPPTLGAKHQAACRAMDEPAWRWLDALPLYVRLPAYDVIVVHAGLVPGVPLEQQKAEDLQNMRSILPDGSPTSRLEGGEPWASRWPGPEEVVFGHDAIRGLQRHPHATGLDTGCVYGGRLTGYVLPGRELLSVPAERVWSAPGGGKA